MSSRSSVREVVMPVSKEQWDLMFAERCASQPHLHPAEIADSLCAFEASVGEAELEEVAWITGGTERDPDLCVHCGLRDGCHYCDCPVHGAWTLNPQS